MPRMALRDRGETGRQTASSAAPDTASVGDESFRAEVPTQVAPGMVIGSERADTMWSTEVEEDTITGSRAGCADELARLLTVVDGPDNGKTYALPPHRCTVGTHGLNSIVLSDRTVSPFHCEINAEGGRLRLRDLQSSNGTLVNGVPVLDACLAGGMCIQLGRTLLRLLSAAEAADRPIAATKACFGAFLGKSAAVRRVRSVLERAANSDATVLLEGETGCGKGAAAQAIHEASARATNLFCVLDCAALPPSLLESELFGHEKGAFTGAHSRRIGVFEDAAGGTVFLDEIGDLPLELQGKLLRVIEERVVRPVGANRPRSVDVRVIAATNRDLRADVEAGRFRADLYFRLAVVPVFVPPLRGRVEDIPAIAARVLETLGTPTEQVPRILTPARLEALCTASWPGNIRELRNYLERAIVLGDEVGLPDAWPRTQRRAVPADRELSELRYAEAKERALSEFEHAYVTDLVRAHGGNVSRAAIAGGLSREYLYRLMRRHGLEPTRSCTLPPKQSYVGRVTYRTGGT